MWTNDHLNQVMSYFKPTLLNLYTAKTSQIAKNVILHASEKFVTCLFYILYHIAVGNISIDKDLYPKYFKSKRASYLYKQLSSKSKLKKWLKMSRNKQLKFILQFSGQFPNLLKKIFLSESANPPQLSKNVEGQEKNTD